MPKALFISIFADAKQFSSELERAAGKTKKFGKAAGVAGVALGGGLAYGLEKSVKAAAEGQASQARLAQAFQNSGAQVTKWTGQISQAESAGNNLGFTNTDVRNSLGTLEIATHKPRQAFKDLAVAEDLARYKHEDLAAATKTLTMAMTGSQRGVKQLGMNVNVVTTATTKAKDAYNNAKIALVAQIGSTSKMTVAQKQHAAALLAALAAQYKSKIAAAQLADKQATGARVIDRVTAATHGMAAGFANSAQGGVARMHAQMQTLEENLGNGLIPVVTKVIGVFADATTWLTKHTTVAKILIGVAAGVAGVLMAVSVASKIATTVTKLQTAATWLLGTAEGETSIAAKGMAAAQWLLNAAMDANPILLIVTGLAALGAAFYLAWTKSATFRRIVTGVFDAVKTVVKAAIGWIASHWKIFLGLPGLASQYWGPISGFFTGMWDSVRGVFDKAVSWVGGHWKLFLGLPGMVAQYWGAISGWFSTLWDGITGTFGNAISWVKQKWGDLVSWLTEMIRPLVDAYNAIAGWATGNINLPKAGSSIPGHANGVRNFAGGWSIVGEKGPELVHLPRGANVFSTRETAGMLAGAGRMAHLMHHAFGTALHGGNGLVSSPTHGYVTDGGVFEITVHNQFNLADGRILREIRKSTERAERRNGHLSSPHRPYNRPPGQS